MAAARGSRYPPLEGSTALVSARLARSRSAPPRGLRPSTARRSPRTPSIQERSQSMATSRPLLDNWPASGARAASRGPHANEGKPSLLSQLETRLDRELAMLRCDRPSPGDDRVLQAHREAFSSVIEQFHTYRPLLARIKAQYDGAIRTLQARVARLEPLQSQLATADQRHGLALIEAGDQHKVELRLREQEKTKLKWQMAGLKQRSLDSQAITRRLEEEVTNLQTETRKVEAAHQLLLAQTRELLQYKAEQEKLVAAMDPSKMYLLERKAEMLQRDYEGAQAEMAELRAEYSSVVPLPEHRSLEQRFASASEALEAAQDELTELRERAEVLQRERDEMSLELGVLKEHCRTQTPRPDLSTCDEFFADPEEPWTALSKGKSTASKLELVLTQFRVVLNDPRAARKVKAKAKRAVPP